MPMPAELLEQQAELLFNNVAGWESRTLERIAKRIKKTGKMNLADIKSIDNMAVTRKEMDDIIKDLAQVTGQNVAEVQKIYGDSIGLQHKNNQYLYDYRNKPFVPLSDNKQLQALVNAYSRTTAETMINLSKTKALGFVDSAGKFTNMQDSIYDALGKATMQVATGSGDFHTAMRGVIEQLGGSGIRVHYGSGVNRRLDTVVRQNLLWGGKQASIEYNDMVGDELGCDGIEIDYHSNPRPSHRFMQGEMFSLHGKKTINGVTYEDAADALERLDDYGCLHFKTPVILGVSEPRYSQEQLNEMRLKDLKMHKVDDVEKTGYEWTQVMRRLETEARKEKEIINGLKAAGDEEGARQHRKKLRAINEKYNKICDETGLTPQKERMRIYGGAKTTDTSTKTIAKSEKSDIMKAVNLKHIDITNDAIDKVPLVDVKVLGSQPSLQLQQRHKEVLTIAQGLPPNTEVGFICDMDGNKIYQNIGIDGDSTVKLPRINKPHITIHNHPDGNIFSHVDLMRFIDDAEMQVMSIVGNDGNVCCLSKTNDYDGFEVYQLFGSYAPELAKCINDKDADGYIRTIRNFILEVSKHGVKFNGRAN